MRHFTPCLALLYAFTLSGCYVQEPLPSQDPWLEPRRTVAEVKAHGDEGADITLADLAAANGLDVKIDKVTGHRVLEDVAGNRVIVYPGNRSIIVNGTEYPLTGEIRWKEGVIWVPGDAPVVVGDHVRRKPVPEVNASVDFAYLDQIDESAAIVGRSAAVRVTAPLAAPPISSFKIDPHAPALPASWNMNARSHTWSYIVIHHSATPEGGAASFGRSHAKKWENGLGYHFVIGNGTETRDGEIEVGPRWQRQNEGIDGAHAGVAKYNKHGIGICLVGDFDKGQPSPRQLAALKNLCLHLMQRYGIPRDHIIPHRAVKVGHTECPGTTFPLEQFLHNL